MTDQTQIFFHVRVLVGVVLALGITRILVGMHKHVAHAAEKPRSATQLLWMAIVLLMAIHFWWFEFGLIRVQVWRFELFLFVLFYAFLFTLMATLLVPDTIGEHPNLDSYFMAHRRWFFGLLAATVPADLIDTLIKGSAYYYSLGLEYPIRLACLLTLCLIAAVTRDRRFHLAFAALYFIYYLWWVLRLNDVLG